MTSEIRNWWLLDFNKTYADNGRGFERHTVSSLPLSSTTRAMLKRPLPEIGVWRFIRPINIAWDEKQFNLFLRNLTGLGSTIGLGVPRNHRYEPFAAWSKMTPYLGFDQHILRQIEEFFDREERDKPAYTHLHQAIRAADENRDHIEPYKIIHRQYEGLRTLSNLGDRFTMITALLECSEYDLIAHLSNTRNHTPPPQEGLPSTWDIIKDIHPPLWMRKGYDISPITINPYKSVTYLTMLEYISGVNRQAVMLSWDVTYRPVGCDDDLNFALTAMAEFGERYRLTMHMPQTYEQICRQWPDLEARCLAIVNRPPDDVFYGKDRLIDCDSGPAQVAALIHNIDPVEDNTIKHHAL